VGSTVNIPGQLLFQFPVTVDCSTEYVHASFEDNLRAFNIVSEHIDHPLMDVDEGASRDTCCGFYIVAVHINCFNLILLIDLCAEVFVADRRGIAEHVGCYFMELKVRHPDVVVWASLNDFRE
jgi:hypothetical protein